VLPDVIVAGRGELRVTLADTVFLVGVDLRLRPRVRICSDLDGPREKTPLNEPMAVLTRESDAASFQVLFVEETHAVALIDFDEQFVGSGLFNYQGVFAAPDLQIFRHEIAEKGAENLL
jgi:hypothetical protein